MNGVIAHPMYAEQIKKAIGKDIIFEAIDEFRDDEILQKFDAAGRIAIDVLVVHTDCAEDWAILKGVRSFHIQRPHTRIIMIAPDRKPGDKLIASIVHLGIYDIIAPKKVDDEEEILLLPDVYEQLKKPQATYADAARWDYDFEKNEHESVKEKVITKERIVGTPTIAVASASRGTGSTYVSIQLSLFLRQIESDVLMMELEDNRHIKNGSILSLIEEEQEVKDKTFRVPEIRGIDLAYTDKPLQILRQKKYDYVVMDIGELQFRDDKGDPVHNHHLHELERATIGCVTAHASPWGFIELFEFLERFGDKRDVWNVLLQAPSEKQTDELRKHLAPLSSKYIISAIPYQPNPFTLMEQTADFCKGVLHDIIPQEEENKKGFFDKLKSIRNRKLS